VIHLVGPVVLAAALTGIGVYGLIARRNAVLVLIGAELLLNGVNVLLVTVAALPTGGLAAVLDAPGPVQAGTADPLLAGQVLAIFVITIAAAEIGVALAVVLLLFRSRATSDLGAVRELGEASPTYTETPGAGEWPDRPEPVEAAPDGSAGSAADAGESGETVESVEGAR
jgi:NADH-quinone oxidoreductase subunit K